jgi:hypothetical protein
MKVSEDDVRDVQPVPIGRLEILFDIPLRIENG